MTQESPVNRQVNWLEAIGLPHILRTLGFAVDPGKIALAAAALLATLLFGGLLDGVWLLSGGGGVSDHAIAQALTWGGEVRELQETEGTRGVFEVWRAHEGRCVMGMLGLSSNPTMTPAVGLSASGLASAFPAGRTDSLLAAGWGVWWMARFHTLYFLLFGAGALLIWSVAGGAICRMAALQFARDEKPTLKAAITDVKRNLFGGYYLAPCIPLAFMLIVALLLVLGGVLLRFPVLGDLLAGGAFFLAIFGGAVIAVLLIGLVAGGSLLWPAVAAEGTDAFDAFSRSMSFVFSKKSVIYVAITVVFAAICWWIVRWFVVFVLTVTRTFVAFGTSPFGWWSRGEADQPVSKLALLWPQGGAGVSHVWPDWSQLAWYECFSGALIGVCVLLVIVLMWSFLASFYYCGSTVVYMLLRRDVDGTDLGDVYLEATALPRGDIVATIEPDIRPDTAGSGAPAGAAVAAKPDPVSEEVKPDLAEDAEDDTGSAPGDPPDANSSSDKSE